MTNQYNAEEIFEIACQIERNGANFYRKAAQLVILKDAKKTLLELADMEDGHETFFEGMKNMDEFNNIFSDPDGVALQYLRAIASTHIFVTSENPAELISEDANIKDVLNIAMQAELASIAYFQAIAQELSVNSSKQRIIEIIEEEKQHLILINKKLSDFNS